MKCLTNCLTLTECRIPTPTWTFPSDKHFKKSSGCIFLLHYIGIGCKTSKVAEEDLDTAVSTVFPASPKIERSKESRYLRVIFSEEWPSPSQITDKGSSSFLQIVAHYSLNTFSEIQFYKLSLYISYLQIFSFGLHTHKISRV